MDQAPESTLMLGIMSGTSLDGLDLALCEFYNANKSWQYRILKAQTVVYGQEWKQQLSKANVLSAEAYFALHARYGTFIGEQVLRFLDHGPRPAAIASHGHTVFHQPEKGFSTQLGCGATIAAHTGISTVCDFRSLDVALGGQGAPLVPVGDEFLFGEYDACLNLGGIANISYRKNSQRLAYDICVANMALNHLAGRLGMDYDADGKIAATGTRLDSLMNKLEAMPFYKLSGARSLGRESFEKEMLHLFEGYEAKDLLHTVTEHIAIRISAELVSNGIKNVLITGGGALNAFLLDRIKLQCKTELIIPDKNTIHFKEALIFGFLGMLRIHSTVNTLSSVTGARQDSVGGAVYAGSDI